MSRPVSHSAPPLLRIAALLSPLAVLACQPTVWCDYDGDGLCPPQDCDDYDPETQACDEDPSNPPHRTPEPSDESDAGPKELPVIFMVDANPGRLDDNCNVLEPFSRITNDPGDRMFINGEIVFIWGTYDDSKYWGQLGGELPNVQPMYDDGTHGDVVAGDGIWSLETRYAEGMGIAYQYSWGDFEEGMETTSEYPVSGQEYTSYARGLNIVDISGDGRVVRVDEFGDETANKGFENCYGGTGCTVTVNMDTDLNADGIADMSERMVDVDNNCTLDVWPEYLFYPELEQPCEGVPVLFMSDINEGRLDDNCAPIDRFHWAVDDRNASMFITGGVHEDSPIQGQSYDEQLGYWYPNEVSMYDDGTHGDLVPGDNIWSLRLCFPKGTKLEYKYTWGQHRETWTGTEEWPGNCRLLEVVDVSGDGFVIRADEFGDETTNKNKLNCYGTTGCTGSIGWDTDQNGDGVADARERKLDEDNDCDLDDWPEHLYPPLVPVVFMADINSGRLDDNCQPLDPFRFAEEDDNAQLYIAGWVTSDQVFHANDGFSEFYSAELADMEPNRILLNDSGLNGDPVAGDGIWSIELYLPRGSYVYYKYTWGRYGDGWAGTQEFPGNSRMLLIEDNSGDGKVIRVDDFSDETTNKAAANCYGSSGCVGTLELETDQNGDGIPDIEERKVDVDNDCTLDLWPEEVF